MGLENSILAKCRSSSYHPSALCITHYPLASHSCSVHGSRCRCARNTHIIIISTVRPPPSLVVYMSSYPLPPCLSCPSPRTLEIFAQTDRRTESLISSVCCLISGSPCSLDLLVPRAHHHRVSPLLSFLLLPIFSNFRPSVREPRLDDL